MWSVPAMFGSAMWPRYPNYTRHRRWNRESPRSVRGETSMIFPAIMIDYLVWVITISPSWNNYKSYGYMLKLSQPYILHLGDFPAMLDYRTDNVYCCIVGCLPHQVWLHSQHVTMWHVLTTWLLVITAWDSWDSPIQIWILVDAGQTPMGKYLSLWAK